MKMKIRNILLMMAVLLVSTQFVLALDVNIDVDDVFYLGDEVSFSYTFLSDEEMTVEYLPYVACPVAPSSLLELRKVELQPNVPLTLEYVYLSKIDDLTDSQECVAGIGIYGPNISEEKSFEIVAEDNVADFDLLTCADEECSFAKKVFTSGEIVYLKYSSSEENLAINSVLIYPDGSVEELVLPNKILLDDVGIYYFGSVASDGNKVMERNVGFSVIEENADIGYSLLDEKVDMKADDADEDGFKFGYVIVPVLVAIFILVFSILRKVGKSDSSKRLSKKKKKK